VGLCHDTVTSGLGLPANDLAKGERIDIGSRQGLDDDAESKASSGVNGESWFDRSNNCPEATFFRDYEDGKIGLHPYQFILNLDC
jgi:hypothetical protein